MESENLIFTGLEIPRDYTMKREDNSNHGTFYPDNGGADHKTVQYK